LEEALAHSRERQLHYFTTERKTKGSFWYRKSVDNLEAYLENERLVLSAARDWYKDEAGQSFTELLEQINTEPDVLDVYRTEIFEPERYRIL
jgi:hypothetical protein